ncbi:MAG TPA: HAD-IA family hydrolase [Chitinophagaceae bacterium]|nr:HAD-IA family hydrolase [Chitinophagaceae bacterium]
MVKNILWDLDGTIVESEDVAFKKRMFSYASEKINLNFLLSPEEFIGHEAKNIFTLLLKKNEVSVTEDYFSLYNNWYEDAVNFIISNIELVKPRDNIVEIWKECSNNGIKNSVVTSSRIDVANAYLSNIGLLDFCETLVCINDVKEPKPSPIPYQTALDRLQISEKYCIAIEDSTSGINSAVSANIYTIAWVKNSKESKYFNANLVTEKLDYMLINKSFSSLYAK